MHPNEVQKQQQRIDAQDAKVNELQRELEEMHAALAALRPKEQVAQRQ